MLFYTVINGVISSAPVDLPNRFVDAQGVQHPIREMWNKGQVAEVKALGYYPLMSDAPGAYNADTHQANSLPPVFDETANTLTAGVQIVPREPGKVCAVIKTIANDKILAIAPEWKQRNMIARSLELERAERTGGALAPAEQAQFDAMQAVWGRIKALRSHSDNLEAAVNAGTLTDIRAGWPE